MAVSAVCVLLVEVGSTLELDVLDSSYILDIDLAFASSWALLVSIEDWEAMLVPRPSHHLLVVREHDGVAGYVLGRADPRSLWDRLVLEDVTHQVLALAYLLLIVRLARATCVVARRDESFAWVLRADVVVLETFPALADRSLLVVFILGDAMEIQILLLVVEGAV